MTLEDLRMMNAKRERAYYGRKTETQKPQIQGEVTATLRQAAAPLKGCADQTALGDGCSAAFC